MTDCFTVRYPGCLASKRSVYREFEAVSIEILEPATREEIAQVSAYQPAGLWKICVNGNQDTIFLDSKSYVKTPDGIKYGYREFSRLAKVLNNMHIERALGAL